MVTPAIENLVNFYNEAEITLIGSFVSIEAMKNHLKVVNTVVLSKKYIDLYNISRKLGGFDVFFSFLSSFRSKFLRFFILSKNKYQYNKNKYQNRHQVEKYNDFVNDSLNTNFPAGKLVLHRVSSLETHHLKLTLGINPGAPYGNAKRWYPQEFAKVASELASQYDIVIFGGPGERY